MKSFTVKSDDGRHSFILLAADKEDAIVKAKKLIEDTKHVNPNISDIKELVVEETGRL